VEEPQKRFINRNRIKTPQGVQWLTVPVVQKGKGRQTIEDVSIAEGNWRDKILGAIQRSYARAVYFDPCFQFLSEIMKRKWTRLSEMNIALLTWLAMEMDIRTPTIEASSLEVGATSTERLVRICQEVGADEYLSGPTGKAYMDESLFEKAGIRVVYSDFRHPVYPQLWGDFVPNLSAIDYLFNVGGGDYETLSGLQSQ